jgi:hypothetical protein
VRGTFTSKIKEATHSVFGAELSTINTQATPSQISEWKNTPSIRRCHANLFKKIKQDQPATYMSKIIEKLRRSSPSKIQIAYAISVAETYLSSDNQVIQMNENIIKPKIFNNLVSFNFQLCINVKMLELN